MEINRQRLLERFLRYVQVDSGADPTSSTYPSSEGQRKLGGILASELAAMGASEVEQDSHALVYATIPASASGAIPIVALFAHMDTSPDAANTHVKPQVVDDYDGGDLLLANGEVIRTDACPELASLKGSTLITTDGSTLLGGDDKAGVAILMELAETLLENPQIPHGPVKLVFTCDEEIGRGTDKIDLAKLGATVGYTLDGGSAGIIDVETFSADGATVVVTGDNIHPAIAKDRMINAVRGASDFIAKLPRTERTPETTEGREGFIHVNQVNGGVGQCQIDLILRSFDSADLETYATRLREIAAEVESEWPGMKLDVRIHRQYRNLGDGLVELPQAVSFAEQAFEKLGREYQKEIIRGGTDGSVLTEKGLPTPNLSSGQHNIHSVREFACLDEMIQATEHVAVLLGYWANQ
ncbi:MAG: peptidase T [Planctomycetota bacterium]